MPPPSSLAYTVSDRNGSSSVIAVQTSVGPISAGGLFYVGNPTTLDALDGFEDFDPAEYIARKEIKRTDRYAQLAIGAAVQAMRSLGLHNMKARVEEAGGSLTITSRPGSTKVTATIPRPFLQRLIPQNHAQPPH